MIGMAALAVILFSCEKHELVPTDTSLLSKVTYATYTGTAPVSGQPLKATVENGIAALACPKAISYFVTGASHSSAFGYPDLFWEYNGGTFELAGHAFHTTYAGKSKDGRLIYTKPADGIIKDTPWSKGNRTERVMKINGETVAVNFTSDKINVVKYNSSTKSFGSAYNYTNSISGLPNGPLAFDIVLENNRTAVVYSLHQDGTAYQESHEYVEQGYYDALGFWRGNIGGCFLYSFRIDVSTWTQTGGNAVKLSNENLMYMPNGMCYFHDAATGKQGVIACGKFGALNFVPLDDPTQVTGLTDGKDNPLIYSGICHNMISMPEAEGNNRTDMIISGEGAPYRFCFTGKYDSNGAPVFKEELVLSEKNDLYCGSLCVPSVVDWDKDGVLDIVAGNSEGRIVLYRNFGTDAAPAFGDPVFLQSCGEEIHFRAGYYEVQGPDDGASWGYICPNVIDWNQDGILDVVTSSASSRYEVMLGTGSGTADCLGPRQTITCDGVELWGPWRQRPGAAEIDGELYMMIFDTDDYLHLYRRISNTAVADCGLVLLEDGQRISSHYTPTADNTSLGYQGRTKIELCDWDGDGDLDVLVGTPKQGCLPFPHKGLPHNGKNNQPHVVYFENIGSNTDFVLKYPKQMTYLDPNSKFALGSHAQSPAGCALGDVKGGINLLIGTESGRMYFLSHKDVRYFEIF